MTNYSMIASSFASALVSGDFVGAYNMLSPALQAHQSPEQLKADYENMLPDAGEPVTKVQCSVETQMDDWPDKEPDDAGWAYVSIFQDKPGATFVEAVTVIVTKDGLVRDLVWGRP
jgi:hypothetical protein